jgi:hypothetical protein
VARVRRVAVAVVHVVRVLLVRDGDMAALRAVLVRVGRVLGVPACRALVGVVAVGAVQMAVVRVVGVVPVRDRDVSASRAVLVGVAGVRGVVGG